MKLLLRIFLIISTCIVAITSNAGTNERVLLWGSTYYGMTNDDVLSNVPGAKRITESTITRDFAATGLVKLDNIVIQDKEFNVILIFNNDKLIKVLVRWIPEAGKNNADMTNLYANISELLNIKYGQPIKSTRQEFGPPLTKWHSQWVKNMQSIDLKSDQNSLQILYGAEYLDDLRNL